MTDIRTSKSVEQDGKESGQEKNVNVKSFGLPQFFLVRGGSEKKTHTKNGCVESAFDKTR